jgi:hypothetical protein
MRRGSRIRKLAFVVGLAATAASAGLIAGAALPLASLIEIGAGLSVLEVAAQYVRRRRRTFVRVNRRFA